MRRYFILFYTAGANSPLLFLLRVAGGELQSLLDRDQMLEERHVARLMRQILEGIEFLHSIKVAHLDIKVNIHKL
jgi:serine/threonine protein kinase